MTAIILIVVLVLIGLYFVNTQRELVRLDENCKNALSQIEVQLNSRWDALTNLAGAAMQYDQHESKTIIETIQARRGAVRTAADVNQQENIFTETLGRLMAVAEAYPNLKSSELYVKTMDGINNYEDLVRMSRMVYNDTATKINRYIRQFPSNIVANILHFDLHEYLKIDDEKKRQAPTLFPQQQPQQPAQPQV